MAKDANTNKTAADIMTPSPRSCTTFSSIVEAVMIFRDADCGAVPVLENGKPVGILTDRDVALALAEHPDLASKTVADVMTKGVVSVPSNATLETVEKTFREHAIRRILVVDGDRLLGIIAWADMAAHAPERKVAEVVTETLEKP